MSILCPPFEKSQSDAPESVSHSPAPSASNDVPKFTPKSLSVTPSAYEESVFLSAMNAEQHTEWKVTLDDFFIRMLLTS